LEINIWIILFLTISIFSFLLTGIAIFIFKKYKKIKKTFIIIPLILYQSRTLVNLFMS